MKFAIILLRYIKGYVLFRAQGGFSERFLNLCSKKGLIMWNMKRENNSLTACMSAKNFLKIRDAVRKSGVKITLIKKSGLIYTLRNYRKREGLIIGLIFFLLFHLIMNQFVWCIDVKGNNSLSDYEIISKANENGLTLGTLKKDFDEIKASRNIAASYEGKVTWMSINIKGSMAIIEMREDDREIKETERNTPCNIVADFDGIILSAETFRGDSMVKVGNGVKKGDLLISGAIDNEDFSTTFYPAKGKITALHDKEITLKSKVSETKKLSATREKTYIGILSFEIPFTKIRAKETDLLFSEKRYLNISGYNLPFYIKKVTVSSENKSNLNEKESRSLFNFTVTDNIYNFNKNSTVISKNEKITLKNNDYIFSGKYTVIDFIGEEKPILSDK